MYLIFYIFVRVKIRKFRKLDIGGNPKLKIKNLYTIRYQNDTRYVNHFLRYLKYKFSVIDVNETVRNNIKVCLYLTYVGVLFREAVLIQGHA